jgi:hypothetical protein
LKERESGMGWTLFFMMVILKIPLAAAIILIWYAIRQEPAPDEGPADDDRGPRRKPPPRPRRPRRGPAGGAGCRPTPCPQLGRRLERPAPAYARRA